MNRIIIGFIVGLIGIFALAVPAKIDFAGRYGDRSSYSYKSVYQGQLYQKKDAFKEEAVPG